MNQPPTTDEMLEMRAANGRITLAELKKDREQYPCGRIYDHPSAKVLPARPGSSGRFDVMPADVAAEIAQFLESELVQGPGPGEGSLTLLDFAANESGDE